MKSGQITVFGTFLAYKHKFNFFSSFVPFYCKRPICLCISGPRKYLK